MRVKGEMKLYEIYALCTVFQEHGKLEQFRNNSTMKEVLIL